MILNWKTDLESRLARISRVATGGSSLRVVVPGGRLALAFPDQRQAAALVCSLYQPQRMTGRLLRGAMKIGLITGGLRMASTPWRPDDEKEPAVAWLAGAAKAGSVGFLGCNPNHGLRCVLAGTLPECGTPFVAKLGFDGAAEAIRREFDALTALHGENTAVVEPMGYEAGEDWALLRLPYLGNRSPKRITDPKVMELLEAWRGDACVRLGDNPWAASLLARLPAEQSAWGDAIRERSVAQALMHGDFAVWNLRFAEEIRGQNVPATDWGCKPQLRALVAIDWEWAEPDGIAGVDLVHALRQEAYMVRKLPATKAIAWMQKELQNPACRDYLEKTGWNGAADDLLRLGLLHSHFNALNPSQELLALLGIHVNEDACSGAL